MHCISLAKSVITVFYFLATIGWIKVHKLVFFLSIVAWPGQVVSSLRFFLFFFGVSDDANHVVVLHSMSLKDIRLKSNLKK